MKVKEIPTDESVGLTLAYDLTGITPGKEKGAVLRRGHVITPADLETLRTIGKSHIKVIELASDEVHEDEAAELLANMLAGEGVSVRMPGEAWADVVSSVTGLLKVDADRLASLNMLDDVLIATRHTNYPVVAGETVAKAKVRGLSVKQAVLDEARTIAKGSQRILEVLPYRILRAAAVITGREVYEGRRKDAFEPLLRRRLAEYGSELTKVEIVPDEIPEMSRAIQAALDSGVDMVLVTGGGSPDDSTSVSIIGCADDVIFQGVPVSPGAMSILAYAGDVPILGVPAGLLARPRGFVDLLLPRLLAGEKPTKSEVMHLGHGALCLLCKTCVFPACPFGK